MDWVPGTETALCGFDHEHSAALVSLPMAPVVVTRNSGVGGDPIVTMAPDMARNEMISDSNSAVLIATKTRASQCGHLAPPR